MYVVKAKVKPAVQGYRVYQYCTKKLDADLTLKMSFLNFISNSLKEVACLIYLGKLFHSTALLKLELHLQ